MVIIMCAGVFCAGFIAAGFAIYERFQQTNARRAENARAWHIVICYLDGQVASSQAPEQRKRDARDIYQHILQLVSADPCPSFNERR